MISPGLNFRDAVDRSCDAADSVVLRYRHALHFESTESEDARLKELLGRTSIREGLRIVPLLHYQGVDIHVLDETSLMHTHTLKAIDGCITTAKCILRGHERIVIESGGNTGTALTEYGRRGGLETFCFVPEENLCLLDSRTFLSEKAHLIAVREPGLVKEAARALAGLVKAKRVPETAWRYQASMVIGCFLLEHMLKHPGYDWLVQTISAGFGPIGIYRVLADHSHELASLPRFLGVQQEANCPLYRAWKQGAAGVDAAPVRSTAELLTRVMYDGASHSYGTFPEVSGLLSKTGGALNTISHAEFREYLAADLAGDGALRLLQRKGVDITRRGGEVVEKTGVMALAGTLKEIASGRIAEGSKVLVCLSSGATRADGAARPEYVVSSLQRMMRDYAASLGGRAHG